MCIYLVTFTINILANNILHNYIIKVYSEIHHIAKMKHNDKYSLNGNGFSSSYCTAESLSVCAVCV